MKLAWLFRVCGVSVARSVCHKKMIACGFCVLFEYGVACVISLHSNQRAKIIAQRKQPINSNALVMVPSCNRWTLKINFLEHAPGRVLEVEECPGDCESLINIPFPLRKTHSCVKDVFLRVQEKPGTRVGNGSKISEKSNFADTADCSKNSF